VYSLYRSSTRGPEDDSVESKHIAPLSHYMFNFTTVVFDGTSPPVISEIYKHLHSAETPSTAVYVPGLIMADRRFFLTGNHKGIVILTGE
jgi:hypothetical protein